MKIGTNANGEPLVYESIEPGDVDAIKTYTITPENFREAVRGARITSGPGTDQRYMPTTRELETINDMTSAAINKGQVIDFGLWPNAAIMRCGDRGGALYQKGALGHPFSTPYVFMHQWTAEGSDLEKDIETRIEAQIRGWKKTHSCAYLVNPFRQENDLCWDFEAMAIEGFTYKDMRLLSVGDRVVFHSAASRGQDKYTCQVIPVAFRFPELLGKYFPVGEDLNQHQDGCDWRGHDRSLHPIMARAINNVMDPMMTALLILNTRNVGQTVVGAPAALNKKRERAGKPPVTPYRRVDSKPYITAVLYEPKPKGPYQGGTHASPAMHIRQSHWRHYQTGEQSFIRDTLVNASDDARAEYRRSHYLVKPATGQP